MQLIRDVSFIVRIICGIDLVHKTYSKDCQIEHIWKKAMCKWNEGVTMHGNQKL